MGSSLRCNLDRSLWQNSSGRSKQCSSNSRNSNSQKSVRFNLSSQSPTKSRTAEAKPRLMGLSMWRRRQLLPRTQRRCRVPTYSHRTGRSHLIAFLKSNTVLKEADKNGQTYPPTVVKISNDTIAVNVTSINDYRVIMHKLAEKRFEHHLPRNTEEIKTRWFEIRGLLFSIKPSDIKSEMT